MASSQVIVASILSNLLKRIQNALDTQAKAHLLISHNTSLFLSTLNALVQTSNKTQPFLTYLASQFHEPIPAKVDTLAIGQIKETDQMTIPNNQLCIEDNQPLPLRNFKSQTEIACLTKLPHYDSMPMPQDPETLALKTQLQQSRRKHSAMDAEQLINSLKVRRRVAPKANFSFDYDSSLLIGNAKELPNQSVQGLEINVESKSLRHRSHRSMNHSLSSDGNSRLMTPEKKQELRLIFNNKNRRQISHLPHLQLTGKSKLREGDEIMTTSGAQRILTRDQFSNQSGVFKSYAQLEQEASILRSRTHNLTESSISDRSSMHFSQAHPRLRNSRVMAKYLSKLQAARTPPSEDIKSMNFNCANVPQQFPIHKFYRYDYDSHLASSRGTSITSLYQSQLRPNQGK